MTKPYDYAVVIGRMQPFHSGHAELLNKALSLAENVVIVLGSAKAARNSKNPFTANERREMIADYLDGEGIDPLRTRVIAVRDYFYSDSLWVTELQEKVRNVINDRNAKVALVGFRKDDSSYYLGLFPGWKFEAHEPTRLADNSILSATEVRRLFFAPNNDQWPFLVPWAIERFLRGFRTAREFTELVGLFEYLKEYPNQWGKGPFVTVDAVVTTRGHVLVIERGQMPGKGLYALPGGFLDLKERIVDGMLRELHEETNLRVDPELLPQTIIGQCVFDHPQRSERGRTITHAFHLNLDSVPRRIFHDALPSVRAGDDAGRAFWMPLYDAFAQEDNWYEDHVHILRWAVMRQATVGTFITHT